MNKLGVELKLRNYTDDIFWDASVVWETWIDAEKEHRNLPTKMTFVSEHPFENYNRIIWIVKFRIIYDFALVIIRIIFSHKE